jgi:soluble lytic murein transglycosylase-like protein
LSQDLRDPYLNLWIGISYLAELRDRYRGDPEFFLAAYNWGPGRLDDVFRGVRPLVRGMSDYVDLVKMGLHSYQNVIPQSCQETRV